MSATIAFCQGSFGSYAYETLKAVITGDPVELAYLQANFDRDGFLLADWAPDCGSFAVLYPAKCTTYMQKIRDQLEVYEMHFLFLKKRCERQANN